MVYRSGGKYCVDSRLFITSSMVIMFNVVINEAAVFSLNSPLCESIQGFLIKM